METNNKTNEEVKELVIRVDKYTYEKIKEEGFDNIVMRFKSQTEYLLHLLLFEKDRDKELLGRRAIGNIADVSEFLSKIQSIDESPNSGLHYDYKKFDEFLRAYSPDEIRGWLADVMYDYSSCIDEDHLGIFKRNVDSLGCLNTELSQISPIYS